MNNKTRRINTGMYSQLAYDVLDSLHGQLSDGIWKDARGYDKYWTNFDVRRDADDRVYFEVSAEPSRWYCGKTLANPFAGMDGAAFLRWVAGKLKAAAQAEAKDRRYPKGWWRRGNREDDLRYLSRDPGRGAAVADVCEIYDGLLGRAAAVGGEVLGRPADAETVRARKKLARAKKELKEAFLKGVARLDKELEAARRKHDDGRKALWDDYYRRAKELDPENALDIP